MILNKLINLNNLIALLCEEKIHVFDSLIAYRENLAVSKNPDQLAEVSAEVSASFAEVSASFAEVSAVHSQKLPRFTHGNLGNIHELFFLLI